MILIRDASVVDGTGMPPVKRDVIVRGDRITGIGHFRHSHAANVIDGAGRYLVPGFIDVNTDSDHYLSLLNQPNQSDSLLQGITTIIGGHCGSSLAPLLYGSLISMRKWADTNQINVDWHSVAELFATLTKRGIGPNFATLIGHSTIRRDIIGDVIREITDGELAVMRKIIGDAMRDGALGISTGLGYAHSRQVPYSELKVIASDVAAFGGLYATHLRDEREGLLASITETIQVAKEAKVPVYINHLRPLSGSEREFITALEYIERNSDLNIHFGSYPFDTSLIPLYTLMPAWAKNGSLEVMVKYLDDAYSIERIAKELPPFGPNDIIIAHAPGADHLAGTTIGTFAANRGLDLPHALVELMMTTRLRANVLFRNLNIDFAIQSFSRPQSLVGSNGPGPLASAVHHERLTSAFSKFLSVVIGANLMSIEQAIRKITAVPALFFRIPERGLIKEGAIADLVLLKGTTVTDVIVAGNHVVKDSIYTGELPGRVLRRA